MKNKSKPRLETIKKYHGLLREFLLSIEQDRVTSASKYLKDNGIPAKFLPIMKKLGYIDISGNTMNRKYYSLLGSGSVEPRHSRKILEIYNSEINSMGRKHREPAVKNELLSDISKFTTEEIFRELKKRGYRGKLNRVESFNI